MSSFQSFPNRAVYEMPLVNGATPIMGGPVPVINNSIPQLQPQMLSNIQQPVVYQSMPFSSPPPIPTNFPLTQNPNVQWMDKSFHCVPGVFAPPPLQPELQQPAMNQSGHLVSINHLQWCKLWVKVAPNTGDMNNCNCITIPS